MTSAVAILAQLQSEERRIKDKHIAHVTHQFVVFRSEESMSCKMYIVLSNLCVSLQQKAR